MEQQSVSAGADFVSHDQSFARNAKGALKGKENALLVSAPFVVLCLLCVLYVILYKKSYDWWPKMLAGSHWGRAAALATRSAIAAV